MCPLQPIASVKLLEAVSLNEGLGIAYARTQHGYRCASWFHDPEVMPYLHSSSVGDLLAAEERALPKTIKCGRPIYEC